MDGGESHIQEKRPLRAGLEPSNGFFCDKTLSQNASGTECNPGAGEVEKRKIVLSFLFPTN